MGWESRTMRKWRTLRTMFPAIPTSTSSSTDFRRPPEIPDRPDLPSFRSIPRIPSASLNPSNHPPVPQIHSRSETGLSDNAQLRPLQTFPSRNTLCLRCGDYGHNSKDCIYPVICFRCRGLGHKKQFCPEIEKITSTALMKEEIGDGASNLISSQHQRSVEREDCMLLDPDVASCVQKYPTPTIISSNEVVKRNHDGQADTSLEVNVDAEDPDFSSCSVLTREEKPRDTPSPECYEFPTIVEESFSSAEELSRSNSMSDMQVELNLDPIRREDFLDMEIIDDFEDFYNQESPSKPGPTAKDVMPKPSKRSSGRSSKPGPTAKDVMPKPSKRSSKPGPTAKDVMPKPSKRSSKPVSPASVRRSPRLNKGIFP